MNFITYLRIVLYSKDDTMKNASYLLKHLSKNYFNTLIKRDPIMATRLGIHKYDHLLPDLSRETYTEDIRILKRLRYSFKQVDIKQLPPDQQVDRNLAIHNLNLHLFDLEELRFWEKDPDVASTIGEAIFPLFVKNFTSFHWRLQRIISRLSLAPVAFEQVKTRVTKPVKIWTKIAIESCDELPIFLQEILHEANKRKVNKRTILNLQRVIKRCNEANNNYKNYLLSILPSTNEEFAIGREKFNKLIKLRELGLSVNEIYRIGKRYLKDEQKKLVELAKKIKPGTSVEQVKRLIQSNHPPDFRAVLDLYQKSIVKSKNFLKHNKLVTLPKNEKIIVRETPVYERHIVPFAAYYEPAKFDKKQIGIYVVTPPASIRELRRHSVTDISVISVHEAYPGHHLQLSCANTTSSLIRVITEAEEFVEGWAHYCEEWLQEQGYDNTSEHQFIMANGMLWRAARIIIDIDLSYGRMSFDDAVNFLITVVKMDKAAAIAEVKRYTQNPGYQLSYLLGKHLINELKKEVKAKMGPKYTDKFFHDTLLYSGSLPIKYIQRILDYNIKNFTRSKLFKDKNTQLR